MHSVENYLKSINALWEISPMSSSHAVFDLGGAHSDFYFNTEILNQDPSLSDLLVKRYLLPKLSSYNGIDWVVSYLPYGRGIVRSLAKEIGAKEFLLASPKELALSEVILPGDKVFLVADDIHSGGSLRHLHKLLRERKVTFYPEVVAFANFSGMEIFEGLKIVSAFQKKINRWSPEECPLCKKGSKAILEVRKNWLERYL